MQTPPLQSCSRRLLPWMAAALCVAAATTSIDAQTDSSLSFFITSSNMGKGANLGGLAGADAHCKTLATAVGAGNRTWHAYLSTQALTQGQIAVNANSRIGAGPWFNAKKVQIASSVANLHSASNNLNKATGLTEKGDTVKGRGDSPNQHDMLTGSQPDGSAFASGDNTCANWTSSSPDSAAMLGHFDRVGSGPAPTSWNSSHASSGCDLPSLVSTGGAGYFYCFAANGPGSGIPSRQGWRGSGGSGAILLLAHSGLEGGAVEHRFTLPDRRQVEVGLFDLGGRRLAVLDHGFREAGGHTLRWDGRDGAGRSLPGGVYLLRLVTDGLPGAWVR